MHVEAEGIAKFEVKETGEIVEVSADELDWDCEVDGEGPMGPEFEHTAEFEVAGYTVTWRIWEYPEGAENNKATECPSGLIMLQDISYHLEHDPEPDDQE
jgi:hypothetical protein